MNIRSTAAHRQSGIALIVLLAVLVIVSATILLDRLGGQANATAATDIGNAAALAEAKAALIAWAVTFPPSAPQESAVGNLPYPDRDVDGGYDGMADCNVPGLNDIVLIGRLPRSGEDTASCGVTNSLNIDVFDSAGEPLWYAVSRNVLAGVGVAGGDSDTTLVGYDVALDELRHGADSVTLTQLIGADEYSRNVFGTDFNDQVRIIEPLSP